MGRSWSLIKTIRVTRIREVTLLEKMEPNYCHFSDLIKLSWPTRLSIEMSYQARLHMFKTGPRGSSHGLEGKMDILLELLGAICPLKPFWAISSNLGPFWSQWDPFGSIWSHLELIGAIESHLKPFGATISNFEQFKPVGDFWSNLKHFGAIWSNLEQCGAIWSYLDLFKVIESHLEPFGAIWRH